MDEKHLSPLVLEGNMPRFQDDIFSCAHLFAVSNPNVSAELLPVLTRCMADSVQDKYTKYPELITDWENGAKVLNTTTDEQFAMNKKKAKIGIKPLPTEARDSEKMDAVLREMNQNCWMKIDYELSRGKGQITGEFFTEE